VAGIPFELSGDLLHRRGEVGGDGNLDLIGENGARGESEHTKQEKIATHRFHREP
jgi:hypothetical protein